MAREHPFFRHWLRFLATAHRDSCSARILDKEKARQTRIHLDHRTNIRLDCEKAEQKYHRNTHHRCRSKPLGGPCSRLGFKAPPRCSSDSWPVRDLEFPGLEGSL